MRALLTGRPLHRPRVQLFMAALLTLIFGSVFLRVGSGTVFAVGLPSWWSGKVCDTNNYPGSYQLSTSATYNGVLACGPGPTQGGTDHSVTFTGSTFGEFEWECVELSMRYMDLLYGVGPYSAPGGEDVVPNYSGSALKQVNNDGSSLPSPGDIISESGTATNPYGHTAVVTAVNVTNGSGSISTLEQNASSTGTNTIAVSSGILQSNVTGWLHNPNGGGPTRTYQVFQWGGSNWTPMTGHLGPIAVGENGAVWGINASNQIFRWNGSGWTQKSGSLSDISVGTDSSGAESVWGVNSTGQIYKWNGSGWTPISGSLAHVAVGQNGVVWGVNSTYQVYRWNGSGWTLKTGGLVDISAGTDSTGAESVWGGNSLGQVFYWNGSGWTQVSGTLSEVGVGTNGAVWGVNSDPHIYRWNGSGWTLKTGALYDISVGTDSTGAESVWGTN